MTVIVIILTMSRNYFCISGKKKQKNNKIKKVSFMA